MSGIWKALSDTSSHCCRAPGCVGRSGLSPLGDVPSQPPLPGVSHSGRTTVSPARSLHPNPFIFYVSTWFSPTSDTLLLAVQTQQSPSMTLGDAGGTPADPALWMCLTLTPKIFRQDFKNAFAWETLQDQALGMNVSYDSILSTVCPCKQLFQHPPSPSIQTACYIQERHLADFH